MARWWEDGATLERLEQIARHKASQPGAAPIDVQRDIAARAFAPRPQQAWGEVAPVPSGQPSRWEMSLWQPPQQPMMMPPPTMREYEPPLRPEGMAGWQISGPSPAQMPPPTWLADYRRRFAAAWEGVGAPQQEWELPEAVRWAKEPVVSVAGTILPQSLGVPAAPGGAGGMSVARAAWRDIEQLPVAGKPARIVGAAAMTGIAALMAPEEALEQTMMQATIPGMELMAQRMREDPEFAARLEGTQFDVGRTWYNLENRGYTADEIRPALKEASRIAYSGPVAAQAAATRIIHGEDPFIVAYGQAVDPFAEEPKPEDLDAYLRYVIGIYQAGLRQGMDEPAARALASQAEQELKVNRRIPGEMNIFREVVGQVILDPLNIVSAATALGQTGRAVGRAEEALGVVEEVVTTPAVAARAAEAAEETMQAAELGKAGPMFATMDEAADIGRRAEPLQNAVQAQRGARLTLEGLVPKQWRKWASRQWGKINPFELTADAAARLAVDDAAVVLGTLVSQGTSTEDTVNLIRRFVEYPDSLTPRIGNLASWGRSADARKLLQPLVDTLEELPSVKRALETGETLNPAHFMLDLDDAMIGLQKAAEVTGPKALIDYQRFAENYRGLMSEFYLRTPGYALRNTTSDLVTMVNDGLFSLDSFDTVIDDLTNIGPTTRRIQNAIRGVGLGQPEEMLLGRKSVLGQLVGRIVGEGAGKVVSDISEGIGGFMATGRIGKVRTVLGEESRYLKAFHTGLMNTLAQTWNPSLPDDLVELLGPVRTAALQGQIRRALTSEDMVDAVRRATATGDATALFDYGRYLGTEADSLNLELVRRLDMQLRNVTTPEEAAKVFDDLSRQLDLDLGKAIAGDPLVPTRRTSTAVERSQDAAEDSARLERAARDAGVPAGEATKAAEEHTAAMGAMQQETETLETALLEEARRLIDAGQDPRRVTIAMRELRVQIADIQMDTRGVVDKMRRELYQQLDALKQLETTGPIGGMQRRAAWEQYYTTVQMLRGDEHTKVRGILQTLQQTMAQGQLPDVADDLVTRGVEQYRHQLDQWLERSAKRGEAAIETENLALDERVFASELEAHRLAFDGVQHRAWRQGMANPSSDALDILSQAERDAQNIGAATAAKVEDVYLEWASQWGTGDQWTKAQFREKTTALWRTGFSDQANRMDLARHELFSLPLGDVAQRTLLQELGWPADAVQTLSPNATRLILTERMGWDAALGGPTIPVAQLEAWTLEGVAKTIGIDLTDPRTIDAYDWGRIADLAERDARLYRVMKSEEALWWHAAMKGDKSITDLAGSLRTLTGVPDYADDAPSFIARMTAGADRLDEIAAGARARQQLGTRALGQGFEIIPSNAETVRRIRVGGGLFQVEIRAHDKTLATATFDNAAEAVREVQRVESAIAHGAGVPEMWTPVSFDDAVERFGVNTADPDDLERLIETAQGRADTLLRKAQKRVDQTRVVQFQETAQSVRSTHRMMPGDEGKLARGLLPEGYRLGKEPRTLPGKTSYDTTDVWYKALSTEVEDAAELRRIATEYTEEVLLIAGLSEKEVLALSRIQRMRALTEIGQGTLLRTPGGGVAQIGVLTKPRRLELISAASDDIKRLAQGASVDPSLALAWEWMDIAQQGVARKETMQLLQAGLIDPTDVEALLLDAPARQALIEAMGEMEEWDLVRVVDEAGAVTFTQVEKAAAAPAPAAIPDLAQGPRLFGEEDLPLFSGTPQRAEAQAFQPKVIPDVTQEALPGAGVEAVVGRPAAAQDSIFHIFEGLDDEVNVAVHKLAEGGMPVEEAANLGLEALDDPKAKEALLALAASQGGMSPAELKRAADLASQAVEPPTYAQMADVVIHQQKRFLEQVRDGMLTDWDELQTASGEKVLPWVRNRIQRWAKQELPPQWAKTRTVAVESARQMADFALLDYSKRRRADNWLGMWTSYSYWRTRSARNWAIRMSQQPATLAHYLRYQRGMTQYAEQQGYRPRFAGTVPIPTGGLLPEWMGGELYVDPSRMFFPFGELAPNDWEDPAEAKNGIDYLYRTLSKWGFRPLGFLDAAAKVTGVAGASGMPGEGTWWQPLVSTPQGTTVQAVRSLLQEEEKGPILNLFGQLNLEEWDSYRIDRMLSSMAADDPELTQDVLLAQSIIERVAMDEIEPKDSLVLGPNMVRLAQVNNWPVEDLERAQRLLGIAWLRAQQEKALPGAISAVIPMGARPYPTGERRQLEMQRESAAAGYDPLTKTGSRAQYTEYMKAHPEAYTRTVAGQMIPGTEITPETWTPLERRGTLIYQPEKAAALEQLGQEQLQSLATGGLWNGDPVRAAREEHTAAMTLRREELTVGEYAWPEGDETWTSLYGSNPEEAQREAERELLGKISNALPRYAQFDDSADYEKAKAAFYRALKAGDFQAAGVEVPEQLPASALAYGTTVTEKDLTSFWRENDTLAEAVVETFGAWYSQQWDLYNAARGPDATDAQMEAMTEEQRDAYYARREAAWQQYVETNKVSSTELAKQVGQLYGGRWSPAEVRKALVGVQMPTTKEAWLGRKSPAERAAFTASEALSDAKSAFWDVYWKLPDDADWRSTKGQPLIALIVDKDTRDLATAEQYQAAAAVLRRYLEDFPGEPGAGAPIPRATGVARAPAAAAPRRYVGATPSGGRAAAPRPAETWEGLRGRASGPLMRQLSALFLRGLTLDAGAMAELQAMMDGFGFSGTIEEWLEFLRGLFKARSAPTAGPTGSYRYRK